MAIFSILKVNKFHKTKNDLDVSIRDYLLHSTKIKLDSAFGNRYYIKSTEEEWALIPRLPIYKIEMIIYGALDLYRNTGYKFIKWIE